VRTVRRAELVAVIGKPCAYCGEPMAAPTRDHIRPRSKGGTLAAGNKAFACQPCNTDKGSRSLRSWLRRLEIGSDPRAVFVRAIVDSLAPIGLKEEPATVGSTCEATEAISNWRLTAPAHHLL
jgi:hypothetical protein